MADSDFDWEANTDGIPFRKHMIAGSIAGVIEHCCSFPLDTVKTLSQAESTQLSLSELRVITREFGMARMWRGVSSLVIGCVPAHALYFSVYEASKKYLGITNDEYHIFSSMAVGACAVFLHDCIMTPMDGKVYLVIKQRMQLVSTAGPIGTGRQIIQKEGLRALYKSLPLTLFMNIPQSMLFMTFYENSKIFVYGEQNIPIYGYFLCSSFSASAAAAITNPLDLVKTRLQTKDHRSVFNTVLKRPAGVRAYSSENRYASFSSTVKFIMAEEGLKGFTRGVLPRMMYVFPGSAISWGTYEYLKKLLTDS